MPEVPLLFDKLKIVENQVVGKVKHPTKSKWDMASIAMYINVYNKYREEKNPCITTVIHYIHSYR